MLPDFPAQKATLMEFWTDYVRQKEREYLGYLAGMPAYRHYEGDRWSIEREDGTADESGYAEIASEFSIDLNEVPYLTPDQIAEKIDAVAQELAKQMHDRIFEELDQAVKKGGTGVSAGGRPLTAELFLQALDSISLDFDRHGSLIPPALVMHPKVWETYGAEMKAWENDREFTARYEEIITRKREDWRARESCRKLVD